MAIKCSMCLYSPNGIIMHSMSNRRLRLSVHRKNEKRKKYGFFPVRIPLESVSMLTVSIPLHQLSLRVSLPLRIFEDSTPTSLTALYSRLAASNVLPQGRMIQCNNCMIIVNVFVGWFMTSPAIGQLGGDVLALCAPTSLGEDIKFNLKIHSDFTWTLHSLRKPIDTSSCTALQTLPLLLNSVASVGSITDTLESCTICPGNDDEKFTEIARVRKGIFKDPSGK